MSPVAVVLVVMLMLWGLPLVPAMVHPDQMKKNVVQKLLTLSLFISFVPGRTNLAGKGRRERHAR
jgi:hypothetical protein